MTLTHPLKLRTSKPSLQWRHHIDNIEPLLTTPAGLLILAICIFVASCQPTTKDVGTAIAAGDVLTLRRILNGHDQSLRGPALRGLLTVASETDKMDALTSAFLAPSDDGLLAVALECLPRCPARLEMAWRLTTRPEVDQQQLKRIIETALRNAPQDTSDFVADQLCAAAPSELDRRYEGHSEQLVRVLEMLEPLVPSATAGVVLRKLGSIYQYRILALDVAGGGEEAVELLRQLRSIQNRFLALHTQTADRCMLSRSVSVYVLRLLENTPPLEVPKALVEFFPKLCPTDTTLLKSRLVKSISNLNIDRSGGKRVLVKKAQFGCWDIWGKEGGGWLTGSYENTESKCEGRGQWKQKSPSRYVADPGDNPKEDATELQVAANILHVMGELDHDTVATKLEAQVRQFIEDQEKAEGAQEEIVKQEIEVKSENENVQTYWQLSGFIVATLGNGDYEIAPGVARAADGTLVPFAGRSLLHTISVQYTSRGRFLLPVRQTGTKFVDTVNGFSEEWFQFAEVPKEEMQRAFHDVQQHKHDLVQLRRASAELAARLPLERKTMVSELFTWLGRNEDTPGAHSTVSDE